MTSRTFSLTAAMLAAIASAACTGTRSPAATSVTAAGVEFTLVRPDARSVAVAGDFNGWSSSSHALRRDKSLDVWTLVVRLPPGEHRFMYIVDGDSWISPPYAEDYVDDGFGAKNGVVVVRP
jgi:1,4-alpha-glucan branching enzyme